jgi:xanthine dehydrogenase accessory factor
MSTSTSALTLFRELIRRCTAGETVALCTLVKTRGSTPQELGAKMLICQDGAIFGTLGGGCVEAEIRSMADQLQGSDSSRLLQFHLDHDLGWDDGMICGGRVDIYFDVVSPESAIERFSSLAQMIERRVPCEFRFAYLVGDSVVEYVEVLEPSPELVIAGAGHVSRALAQFASQLDFDLVVIDDRREFATPDRFPPETKLLVGEIASTIGSYPISPSTYIVLATRGHKRDGKALAAVVSSPARYIGMIGSKRKAHAILSELAAQGVPKERLERIHTPMGLEINAITVNEIAISILAELIAVRRDREGFAAEPMWLQRSTIDRLDKLVNLESNDM